MTPNLTHFDPPLSDQNELDLLTHFALKFDFYNRHACFPRRNELGPTPNLIQNVFKTLPNLIHFDPPLSDQNELDLGSDLTHSPLEFDFNSFRPGKKSRAK